MRNTDFYSPALLQYELHETLSEIRNYQNKMSAIYTLEKTVKIRNVNNVN